MDMEAATESTVMTRAQVGLRRFLILLLFLMLHGFIGFIILLIGITPYGSLKPEMVAAAMTMILIGLAGVILCWILPRRMACMRGIKAVPRASSRSATWDSGSRHGRPGS